MNFIALFYINGFNLSRLAAWGYIGNIFSIHLSLQIEIMFKIAFAIGVRATSLAFSFAAELVSSLAISVSRAVIFSSSFSFSVFNFSSSAFLSFNEPVLLFFLVFPHDEAKAMNRNHQAEFIIFFIVFKIISS